MPMSHPEQQLILGNSLKRDRTKKTVDAMAYAVGVLGNAAVIPQIIKAWESDAPGLSVTTWLLFSGIGLVWLAYAILHKQKPLILAQTVCIIANLAVVTGWLFNNLR